MTLPSPTQADPDDEPFDPGLQAIAAAILDGEVIDWASWRSGPVENFATELRIVADLAGLHRSLPFETAPASRFTPELPRAIGTLTLTRSLGSGSFGEVFRAWDTRLQRDVAVKLLFRDRGDENDEQAFLREGRLLARVRHANVVTVHGAELMDGRVGLITEFVDGRTLAEVVRAEGPLPLDEAVRIGLDLCRALIAVHDAGLLHRDIKPQNVMRQRDGRIVLMDFGAGHHSDAIDQALAGTPLFLAPEVLAGKPATVRSDVYSFGVLLYHLVTGSYPVTGRSLAEIRKVHAQGRRTSLRDLRPDAPDVFIDVVETALVDDPADRFQSAGEFETALRKVRATEVPAAAGSSAPATGPRAGFWLTWVAIAGAAVLIAAAVSFGDIRARLGGRDQEAPVVFADTPSAKVRRLAMPPFLLIGSPSRDGRYIPFTANGEVSVLDIGSGRSRQVTDRKTTPGQAGDSAISPDGSLIGYAWELPDGSSELRVANIDETWPTVAVGGAPPLVALRGDRDTSLVPIEWSRDGQQILCWAQRSDGAADLVVAVRTGASQTIIQTFRERRPRHVGLSPDGRYVVYDLAVSPPAPQHDLFIVGTDGSAPRVLLADTFDDTLPVWTPDGGGVFFLSDRAGSIDGWVVKVADSVAQGDPTRVAKNLERVSPLGFSDAGALYYTFETKSEEVYSVSADEPAGPSDERVAVPRGWATAHRGPAWSPDGQTLAYFSTRGMRQPERESVITMLDVSTGRTRNVLPSLSYFAGGDGPRWSPSGRELLIRGRDFHHRWGYFRVDAVTGATTPVVLGRTADDIVNLGAAFHWMPSGDGVAYNRLAAGVVVSDFATGGEKVLVSNPPDGTILSFGFAPDGQRIALSSNRGTGPQDGAASLEVQSPDGVRRTLVTMQGRRGILFQAWTPDGRDLIYSSRSEAAPVPRLWRIPAIGGTPQDMLIPLDTPYNLNFVALAPGGRRVAFTAGRSAFEIWSMEGFLPRSKP